MKEPLDCQNFQSQSVVSCQAEPIAICASQKKLFVATSVRTVQVYDLSSDNSEQSHRFHSESLVTDIHYNVPGNYVATIETKETRNKSFQFVRVYLNWESGITSWPTKVRMSGEACMLNIADIDSGQMEVINVEYSGVLMGIATCDWTCNLAIASGTSVTVLRLVEKSLPKTNRSFKDIQPFVEIDFGMSLTSVQLCDDYLAVHCPTQAIITRLSYHTSYPFQQRRYSDASVYSIKQNTSDDRNVIGKPRTTSFTETSATTTNDMTKYSTITLPLSSHEKIKPPRPTKLPTKYTTSKYASKLSCLSDASLKSEFSTIQDSDDCIVWDFSEHEAEKELVVNSVVFTKSVAVKKLHEKKPLPKTVHFDSLKSGMMNSASDTKVTVINKPGDNTTESVTAEVVLSVTFDCIRHLILVPTFNPNSSLASMSMTLGPSNDDNILGMSCYIGTEHSGYMYSLMPHPYLMSTYAFDNASRMVCCDSSKLYVITDCALETYTARCGAVAARSRENVDYVSLGFPSVDLPPTCLCSQPFMDIQKVAVTCGHVVLLSKVTCDSWHDLSDSGEGVIWSLYALQSSPVTELTQQLISMAKTAASLSESLTLLQEAFLLLKSHGINTPACEVEDSVKEVAALLGEFYTRPDCDDWKLALPYLTMSLGVAEVVRRAIEYADKQLESVIPSSMTQRQRKKPAEFLRKLPSPQMLNLATELGGKKYGKGLMHYLNHTLFDDSLTHDLSQATCDQVIHIYREMDSEYLSSVILYSAVKLYQPLTTLDVIKHCELGASTSNIQSERYLAISVLHLQCCEPELAEDFLAKVPPDHLLDMCIRHPNLIHTDLTQLSPLAQLMRQHFAGLFIEVMVALLYNGSVAMDTAIQMISGNSDKDRLHEHAHVQLYLEALLTDEEFEELFSEASLLLCDIYLTKVLVPERPATHSRTPCQMSQEQGHFGARYPWLDNIPPLKGASSYKPPCPHLQPTSSHLGQRPKSVPSVKVKVQIEEPCSCCWCNEVLLKLQSLLCSRHTTSTLRDRVTDFLLMNPSATGLLSLEIICLLPNSTTAAAQLILDNVIHVLPEFVATCVDADDMTQWRHIFAILSVHLDKATEDTDASQQITLNVYRGVLSVMADSLPLPSFLTLLPSDGNLAFFSTYIQQCCHNNDLKRRKWDIMQRGATLKSSI